MLFLSSTVARKSWKLSITSSLSFVLNVPSAELHGECKKKHNLNPQEHLYFALNKCLQRAAFSLMSSYTFSQEARTGKILFCPTQPILIDE